MSLIFRGFRRGLAVLAAALALVCSCGNRSEAEKAAEALARRVLPHRARSIDFRIEDSGSGEDFYTLETKGRRLVITGNSANSLAMGLGAYLKDYCHVSVSWTACDRIPEPRTLPKVETPVRRKALMDRRFFLNYCTFGYTMQWWKWKDWERLIDWMALNGVNMALATTGQESVCQEVWRQFGLSEEEIAAYFPGPSYLPWHRMSNVDAWHSPLPQGWLDAQRDLQRKIMARELELGITPVLSAFNGHVPAGLREHYPGADIRPLNAWGNFSQPYNPWYLNPSDPLFAEIQTAYLAAQKRLYGEGGHVYGVDLFNEVVPPSWEPDYLARTAESTYASLVQADPEAVWLQMGWLFWHKRGDWTPERIEAFISPVPKGRLLLLDYYCDKIEVFRRTECFHGQDFIWCYLGNFGGNTMIAGDFADISAKLDALAASLPANCAGVGCTLEALDVNMPMYEYVLDRAWERTGTDADWIEGLADRRFGAENIYFRAAWKLMADKVQKQLGSHTVAEVPIRPNLEGFTRWGKPELSYDNRDLLSAWGLLVEAGESKAPAARFDAVNFARQCLDNHFTALYQQVLSDYSAGDSLGIRAKGERMLEILRDLDRLVGSDPYFLLGRWAAMARSWGATPSEKEYYEDDARNILSCWGEKTCRYVDYPGRDWNGLISTYYYPRWERFLRELADGSFDPEAFEAWAEDFSWNWIRSRKALPEKPEGNPYRLSRELYEKYSPEIGEGTVRLSGAGRGLRLMSYNIRFITPKDTGALSWDSRRDANLRMFRAVKPDVAGLQEAVSGIASFLEAELPEYALWEAAIDSATLTGNGILWRKDRFDCIDKGVFFLGENPSLPVPSWDSKHIRSTQWVRLREKGRRGQEFFVFNTHLDHRGHEAKKNGVLLNISKIAEIAGDAPVFLTGDMNIRPESPDGPSLLPLHWAFSDARESAPESSEAVSFSDYGKGKHPAGNLDHIFYRGAEALRFTVEDGDYGVAYISDHYPIVCDFAPFSGKAVEPPYFTAVDFSDGKWVAEFADRRFGRKNPLYRAAWNVVARKVLGNPGKPYDNRDLLTAWGLLVDAGESASPGARYDAVNFARRCLSSHCLSVPEDERREIQRGLALLSTGAPYRTSRELYQKYSSEIGCPKLDFPEKRHIAWLDTAVIYHIYPPSFKDSDADGIGDLEGIRSKLGYIRETGFNTIWISPVFASCFEDGGYDITDYYSIAPRYGTNADLERLVSEAHGMGLRVCLDLVAGHSSDKHPWFRASASGKGPYRDYYVWTSPSDPLPEGKWVSSSYRGGSAYMKNYYDVQPALNYGWLNPSNPWEQPVDAPGPTAVRQELENIISYWFDRGVDGFRCDMAWSLIKGDDAEFSGNKALWRGIIGRAQEKYPDRIFIAEWSSPLNAIPAGFDIDIIRHKGDGEIIYRDLVHNTERYPDSTGVSPARDCYFSLEGRGQTASFAEAYGRILKDLDGHGFATVPTSSHDTFRLRRAGRDSQDELKTALTLFLTMPWVPIVYYGEEIGMRSMDGLPDKEGSRDRSAQRTPMQWDSSVNAGFSTCDPSELYLPVDASADRPDAESQMADSASVYNWVKGLLALRREHPALGNTGEWEFLSEPSTPYPAVYAREGAGERFVVLLNPSGRPASATVDIKGPLEVLYGDASALKVRSSAGGTKLTLAPVSSVICRERLDTVRILGVGNSWTRDCMRYLSAIAASAGKKVIAGHGYLGGSTLEEQYRGLSDTSFFYIHNGWEQKVHSTYQYWKYTCSDTPVKTPSEGYRNGAAGIGVTLSDIISDEPWDYVVFQPEATLGGELSRMLGRDDPSWDLAFLVDTVKSLCLSDPAVGLMVPFAYPEGNTDYRSKFVALYNGGVWPSGQREWDSLYVVQYHLIQEAVKPLAEHIGASFTVPVGNAVQAARASGELSRYGYLLQRSQDNTHLAEGLPKYLASLCYAYVILGLRPEEISFCPPGCTPEDAALACSLAWKISAP